MSGKAHNIQVGDLVRCKNIASLFSPLGNIIVGRAYEDDIFLVTNEDHDGFFHQHVGVLHPRLGVVMIYAHNVEVNQCVR